LCFIFAPKSWTMFSKACEYAIRASAYIAQQSLEGRRVNLKEIAATIGSPVAFTGKILQQLSRSGIVDSTKGAQGGFEMTRSKLDSLCLADIVMALDGEGIFTGCGLGRSEEHTSELQSRENLVCRLLLEKKKKKTDDECDGNIELRQTRNGNRFV